MNEYKKYPTLTISGESIALHVYTDYLVEPYTLSRARQLSYIDEYGLEYVWFSSPAILSKKLGFAVLPVNVYEREKLVYPINKRMRAGAVYVLRLESVNYIEIKLKYNNPNNVVRFYISYLEQCIKRYPAGSRGFNACCDMLVKARVDAERYFSGVIDLPDYFLQI